MGWGLDCAHILPRPGALIQIGENDEHAQDIPHSHKKLQNVGTSACSVQQKASFFYIKPIWLQNLSKKNKKRKKRGKNPNKKTKKHQ